MKKNKNRLAVVRSALTKKVSISPNQIVQVIGTTDKVLDFSCTTAIIQESKDSQLPESIDVTPSVIQFDSRKRKQMVVSMSNLSTQTVAIAPRAIICEIQPVTVEEEVFTKIEDNTRDEVLKEINIDEEDLLNPSDKQRLIDLLKRHGDIFSTSDTYIGVCNRIKQNQTPNRSHHRCTF